MVKKPTDEVGLIRRAGRYLFLNRRTGGITVAQWPNVPLAVFIVATLALRLFHPNGTANGTWHVVGTVALIAWALDEIIRGVNPFRRMLGGAVLLATIASLAAS
jgi:hypothetical protein